MNFGIKKIGSRTVRGNETIAPISSCNCHNWGGCGKFTPTSYFSRAFKVYGIIHVANANLLSSQGRESRSKSEMRKYDTFGIIKLSLVRMSRNKKVMTLVSVYSMIVSSSTSSDAISIQLCISGGQCLRIHVIFDGIRRLRFMVE